MNQGKLEVVKQEMARVNINILDGMGREVGWGSCLGTHVHPWWIHVNVWQNQYSIVK